MSHTPGPWECFPKLTASENHRGFVVQKSGTHKWRLADVVPMDEDGKEGAANARLIAAAPDLLAALRELMAAGDEVVAHCGTDGPLADAACERNHRAWNAARAAIAKAEGHA